MKLAENQHYQLACAKAFEIKHAKHGLKDIEDIASGIVNPNQYFEKSIEIMSGKIAKQQASQDNKSKGMKLETNWSKPIGSAMDDIKDEDFEIEDDETNKQELPDVKEEDATPDDEMQLE